MWNSVIAWLVALTMEKCFGEVTESPIGKERKDEQVMTIGHEGDDPVRFPTFPFT